MGDKEVSSLVHGITVTIVIRVHQAGGDLFMKRRLFIISFIGAFIIGFIIIYTQLMIS